MKTGKEIVDNWIDPICIFREQLGPTERKDLLIKRIDEALQLERIDGEIAGLGRALRMVKGGINES